LLLDDDEMKLLPPRKAVAAEHPNPLEAQVKENGLKTFESCRVTAEVIRMKNE
jgi:hypothetical protein